jgi:hypothetical protein
MQGVRCQPTTAGKLTLSHRCCFTCFDASLEGLVVMIASMNGRECFPRTTLLAAV